MGSEHPSAYGELCERLAEISDLGRARALLAWDERTMMPRLGAAGRAEQIATLVRIRHQRLSDDGLWRLIEGLQGWAEALEPGCDEAAMVRMARRDSEKARQVPAELRAEMARAASIGETAWVEARERSDFGAFRTYLQTNLDLRLRYAECFEDCEHPYDALLDDYEPGARTSEIVPILVALRAGLVPLVAAIAEHPEAVDDSALRGEFEPDAQERLMGAIVALLPLPEGGWRLDPTVHPFESTIADGDVRLTTRYESGDLGFALFSALHEAGHGIYEAGVPTRLRRSPLGRGASLGFHESQSRLWENWVGRSRPFLSLLLPLLAAEFPQSFAGLEPEALYRAANRAGPSAIRVEADEVTYNLHIALRFELELELIEGSVSVAELPELWRERMRTYLGVEIADDAEGVLQDVHWASGSFGYFPTYSLGNVIAAQLWELIAQELPDLDERIAAGDLGALRDRLDERVYSFGGKLMPDELAVTALGGPLDVAPLLRQLGSKYGELYGFDPPRLSRPEA